MENFASKTRAIPTHTSGDSSQYNMAKHVKPSLLEKNKLSKEVKEVN